MSRKRLIKISVVLSMVVMTTLFAKVEIDKRVNKHNKWEIVELCELGYDKLSCSILADYYRDKGLDKVETYYRKYHENKEKHK